MKFYGVKELEGGRVLVATYLAPKGKEKGNVFIKVIMRKNESLQVCVANEDDVPATAVEEYLQTANVTVYDELDSKPFISFSDFERAANQAGEENAGYKIIRHLRLIEGTHYFEDDVYELEPYFDEHIVREWGYFYYKEALMLLTFPQLSYFGFNINIAGLSEKDMTALLQAKSKKDVWRVFFPNLSKKAITVLERSMPMVTQEMIDEDVDLEDELFDNGSTSLSGAVFNVFANVDRLTAFIEELDAAGFEKFNGRLDFLTHLGLRTPIINGETLEMNGENLRTYFLPFFNGSQEQLEKALVKSVKVVAKDNEAYVDSLGMGDYDEIFYEGGTSVLKSLEELISDTIKMLERIEGIDETTVDFGVENKANFHKRKFKSIQDLHDAATKLFYSLSTDDVPFEYDDVAKQRNMMIKDFEFFLPKSSAELRLIGDMMKHCVGSYDEQILSGEVHIVVVKKDDDYVLCLELKGNELLQCKKKYNGLIHPADGELVTALQDYMQQQSLQVKTQDLCFLSNI